MATRTHPCPGGCGAEIALERLSCPVDWRRLPKVLRDEVNAAYRSRFSDRSRHIRAMAETFKWYRAHPRVDTSQAVKVTSQS